MHSFGAKEWADKCEQLEATIADLQGQVKLANIDQANVEAERNDLQQRVAQLEGEIEAVEHFYQMEKQRDTALLRWQVKEALAASLPAQPAQGGANG